MFFNFINYCLKIVDNKPLSKYILSQEDYKPFLNIRIPSPWKYKYKKKIDINNEF